MLTSDKSEVISRIYNDVAGFGSIAVTYKDAKAKNKSITLNDVKQWFLKNVDRKTQLKGYNSYIPFDKNEEIQIDLFWILDLPEQKDKIGMIGINAFTKKMTVVPIKSKSVGDVLAGILETFQKQNVTPLTIYVDEEPAINNKEVIDFLEKKGVRVIFTRGHAGMAERGIKTFKSMLYKRIEAKKDDSIQWTDLIYPITLTYNNKLVHATTKFTPAEAEKKENEMAVAMNIALSAKHNRRYPELNKGDKVKVYQKRKQFDKERISLWSDNVYTIENIEDFNGQLFYTTSQGSRKYIRSELLKIS